METRTLSELYSIVARVASGMPKGSRRIGDRWIVLAFLYAAMMDKPLSWACQRRHWPAWVLRWMPVVPSSTTMSRRLRTPSVRAMLDAALALAQASLPRSLTLLLDGKPLPVGGNSGDRQASVGRACGLFARGYRLHLLLEISGRVVGWRVASMRVSEQAMAERLTRDLPRDRYAYLLADAGYDSNKVHGFSRLAGVQMVAPRRRPHTGLGKGKNAHDAGRLRSLALTEGPSPFGRDLSHARAAIERWLGAWCSSATGLTPLPAHVRTWPRVERWILGKLILNAVRLAALHRRQRAA